ncbi:hypothetical protein D8Y22_06550 [Salinadaptatus halalkaliphilus]|uniref:Uncharacterized protein n=1 Tax=Salinadaptatus halalkaliphilus TaxID=2419781 RepID=A0A4S3TN03_9EURY|nr:hypothetical protein [Salinadaptatus halalkaliphilus]THE65659.1 hypothetical protein D8Y22_06550 [Salinadaptatus halalkaliphilus]
MATGQRGRRSVLRMAGGAVVGTALVGTASATDYETVTVSEGQRDVIEVEDGETLENVVYDVTASGAGVTIVATGTDWTIRNIAVWGQVDMGDRTVLGVADTDGGTSRIENVWLGDGSVYEEKGATGLWVDPDHDGHLEIERVNIQEMSDNAFYCSPPGSTCGCGGMVTLRDCYAANSWVSQYRVADGTLENCVASVTDDRQYRQGRGLWAWPAGPVYVRDSEFDMNGHHYSFVAGADEAESEIIVSETEIDTGFHGGWDTRHGGSVVFEGGNGTDPENVVPDGCPTSVVDAAGEVFQPSVADYADPATGTVTTFQMQRAYLDYEAGDIDATLVQQVYEAWQSGEPVQ